MTTTHAPRAIRKDAVRNRALLLESADAMTREHGVGLTCQSIARHAGVGVGTVYRHFFDRDALIDAMFEQRLQRIVTILKSCLTYPDPVAGLRAAALDICHLQTVDRGLWEVASSGSRANHHQMVQARALHLAEQLVTRANATGRLRMGFEAIDLPVLIWTGGALNAYLGRTSPDAWRRYVELALNGYLRDDDPARDGPKQRPLTHSEFDVAVASCRLDKNSGHSIGVRRG